MRRTSSPRPEGILREVPVTPSAAPDPSMLNGGSGGSGGSGAAGGLAGSSSQSPGSLGGKAFRLAEVLFGIIAVIVFMFGVTGSSEEVVQVGGYDEVFVVVGSLFVIPVVYSVYEFLKGLVEVSMATQAQIWIIGLRITLVLCYIGQQVALNIYLVRYVGPSCYIFIGPDVILLILMLFSKWTSVWTTFFILVFTAKIGVFWPNLDQSGELGNAFANKDNALGENGLLATLFLTLPIIQFPVIVSRVATGCNIFEAYATNMAAVFAHILHLLDCMELYFLGLQRLKFTDDVQYLILMFSLMGCVTCNLYYVSLFFHDDSAERTLRKLQPAVVGVFAGDEGVKDESMIHYFVWMLFFVDLPYCALRFIAFLVHGTQIPVFFAKNLMMMASVAMLIIKHARTTTR